MSATAGVEPILDRIVRWSLALISGRRTPAPRQCLGERVTSGFEPAHEKFAHCRFVVNNQDGRHGHLVSFRGSRLYVGVRLTTAFDDEIFRPRQ
jgi:hypothetical protein